MGIKLSSLEPDTPITIYASTDENSMRFDASIKKVITDDLALITIDYEDEQILNFENVDIQIEYSSGDTLPYIWKQAQVVHFRSEYVLKVPGEAKQKNRRECFRVGISRTARLKTKNGKIREVLIKDISLSGFAITDRNGELELSLNDVVSISFEDIGHCIDLVGHLVRIEEREQMMIYGFEITNICKDLSSYVNCKQRQKRI